MRATTALCLGILSAVILMIHSCPPSQGQNGCKISAGACICGYGCKTEYIYRYRAQCHDALIQRSSNACSKVPCLTGICIQTAQDPGFSCKCEGTGFYGQRCENACPTVPVRGQVFPHECIVI